MGAVTLDVPNVRVDVDSIKIWATKTRLDPFSRRYVDASEYVPWDTVVLTTLPLVTRDPVEQILAVGQDSFLFYAEVAQIPAPDQWRPPDQSTCSLKRGYFDGTPVATVATNVAHWYGGIAQQHALLPTARGPAYFFHDSMHAQLFRIDEQEPLLTRAGRWVLVSADGHWGLLYDPSQSDLYVADLTSVGPTLETRLLASHIKPAYGAPWELMSPRLSQSSVVWGADDYLYFWDLVAFGDSSTTRALRRAKASGGPQELVAEQTVAHDLQIGQNRIFWRRDSMDPDSWMGARPDGTEAFDVRALAGDNAGQLRFLDDLRGATFGDPPTRAVLFDAPTQLLSARRFIPFAGALFAESTDDPPRISRIPFDGGPPMSLGSGFVVWRSSFLGVVSSLDTSIARTLTLLHPSGDVFAVANLAPQEDANWSSLIAAPDGKTYLYQTSIDGLPGACGEGGCRRTTLHLRMAKESAYHLELGQDIEPIFDGGTGRPLFTRSPVYTRDSAAVVFWTLPMNTPWDEFRTLRIVGTNGTPLLALEGFDGVTWSPDERRFVALSGVDNQTIVLVTSAGQELMRAQGSENLWFSSDGSQLLWSTGPTGAEPSLHIASAESGQELLTIAGASGGYSREPYLMFTREGTLCSKSGDQVRTHVNGYVRAWISDGRALVSHTAHPALPPSLHLLDLAR